MNLRTTIALLTTAWLSAPALAQHEQELEAKELIARIRKEMKKIDELLLRVDDAAPAEAKESLEQVTKSIDELLNVEELLKSCTESQNKVIDDIEQLVRMTKYSQSNQGQSGQPDPKQQQQQRNRERERDEEPDELKQQGRPKERGEQPQPKEPQPMPQQQDPKDGGPDAGNPEQRDAEQAPPQAETEQHERKDVTGRWGNLPPKVEELFQNLGPDQFPVKYRKLLDQYYYKANKKKD